MSYVQNVLQPGETVRHTARVHWIVYWPGALMLVLALIVLIYGELTSDRMIFWQIPAGILALIGLVLLVPEWFSWWTTEIAVTNLRVIYKTGFIRRMTNEMNMDKVESVQVDQSHPWPPARLRRRQNYRHRRRRGKIPERCRADRVAKQHYWRLTVHGEAFASSGKAERGSRSAFAGRARSGSKSPSRHQTTSPASRRRSSPRCARSPAQPRFLRISSSTTFPANGSWSRNRSSSISQASAITAHSTRDCTVAIGKRLFALLKPKWLRIGGYWYPRGGMPIDVFWQAGKLPANVWVPDQGVAPYRGRG